MADFDLGKTISDIGKTVDNVGKAIGDAVGFAKKIESDVNTAVGTVESVLGDVQKIVEPQSGEAGGGTPLWDRLYRLEIYAPEAASPQSKLTSLDTTVTQLDPKIKDAEKGETDTDELDLDVTLDDVIKGKAETDPRLENETITVDRLAGSAPKLAFEGYYDVNGRPGLFVTWDATLGIDAEPPTGNVEIYNLNLATARQIQDGDLIRVYGGHRTVGMKPLFDGTISKETDYSGADKVTILRLVETRSEYAGIMAKREGRVNDVASQVIKELLRQLPIPFMYEGVGRDLVYRYGKAYDQTIPVFRALAQLAADTESKFYVYLGRAWWRPLHKGEMTQVLLSDALRNIIGEPVPVQDEKNSARERVSWRVTTFIDGRLKPSALFRLESKRFTGLMRVVEVTYKADYHDFYAICDCAVYEDPADLAETTSRSKGEMAWLLSAGQDKALRGAQAHDAPMSLEDLVKSENKKAKSNSPIDPSDLSLDSILKKGSELLGGNSED